MLCGCGLFACGEQGPDPTTSPSRVKVPGGTALVACRTHDPICGDDEQPPREVVLGAFEIDRTEVTVARYQACVDAGACTPPGCPFDAAVTPDLPVSCLTWDQAQAFCAFAGGRLPTEAEWERAARAGARIYPWGDDKPTCAHAVITGCGGAPQPVGGRLAGASEFGALDMAGNVREWVADWYDPVSWARLAGPDPRGPSEGSEKVTRGGAYDTRPEDARSSFRFPLPPTASRLDVGVRCARSLPPSEEGTD